MHLRQALQVHKLKVLPPRMQQLRMGPMLDDPALVEDVDHVCLLDRAEPMCDRDGGSPLRRSVQSCLDDLLRLGVQSGGRFVEEEDFWITEERARDGDALLLAAGEHTAF